MIPEPLEGLSHAPPFSKLHEYKSNGFANPLIGMQGYLAHWIQNIANWKPFEQLAAARFGLLSRLHSLPNHLQFNNTQSPFYSQNQLVIEIIKIVYLLFVGDERTKDLAYLQQSTPVFVGSRQS
jgi:hypothetical protein